MHTKLVLARARPEERAHVEERAHAAGIETGTWCARACVVVIIGSQPECQQGVGWSSPQ